jgi:hypothetical protein
MMTGYVTSNTVTQTFTITSNVAPPVFSITPGDYTDSQSVTITSSTPDAEIFYTVNGGDPSSSTTTNVILYTGPIPVASGSADIKAYATRTGWQPSPVVENAYTITGQVPMVTFSPDTSASDNFVLVSLSLSDSTFATTNPTVVIKYTQDGSVPSRTHGTMYTGSFYVGAATSTTLQAMAFVPEWQSLSDSVGTVKTYTVARSVYCAGTFVGATTSACLWNNGAVITLAAPSSVSGAIATYAAGICDDGTYIYVSGSYQTSDLVMHACAWMFDPATTTVTPILLSPPVISGVVTNGDAGGSNADGITKTSQGIFVTGYFTAQEIASYSGDTSLGFPIYTPASYWYMKCPCYWALNSSQNTSTGTETCEFSIPYVGAPNIIPTTDQAITTALGYSVNGTQYNALSYATDGSVPENSLSYAFNTVYTPNGGTYYISDVIVTSTPTSENALFFGYQDVTSSRSASIWAYTTVENTTTHKWGSTVQGVSSLQDGANGQGYYGITHTRCNNGIYYCAGYRQLMNGHFLACYWRGDSSTITTLPVNDLLDATNSLPTFDSFATDIGSYSATGTPYTYVVGYETQNSTNLPVLWINSQIQTLTANGTLTLSGIVVR